MALTRRAQRMNASIWPGFVDAMTALLLVLMFVLSIFMIVQALLRDTISGQESELDKLAGEITSLSQALGVSQQRSAMLEDDLDVARAEGDRQLALIDSLTTQLDTQARALSERDAQIASFEDRVATLLSERDAARDEGSRLAATVEELETARTELLSEQEALNLALAQARDEIDSEAEAARLAAARADALQALTDDLRARSETAEADAAQLADQLSDEEAARLAEAAAAQALRERLQNADAELTAMSLALEEQRREAEETLTLLAAAEAVEADLNAKLSDALIALEGADETEGALEDAEMRLAIAETQRQTAEAQLATLRSDLSAAEARLAELGETAEARDARLADVVSERDTLRAEVEGLRAASTDAATLRERLASALAAKIAAEADRDDALTEADRQAALLASAKSALADEEDLSTESQRRVQALNAQVAALRSELGGLQDLLDEAEARDSQSKVRIETLGSQLNTALARAAQEERRRAELEADEAERLRQEAERLRSQAENLENYRSNFFGELRRILGDREGVQVVGDRFVFSSEVLFQPASASLSAEGRAQIAQVAGILQDVAGDIPAGIDWIIRVDGHTDDVPLSGDGAFRDNWELSQARALSVVRYMTDQLGFPPERLAATGFGEYRPVDPRATPEARAANRRIELKLTER